MTPERHQSGVQRCEHEGPLSNEDHVRKGHVGDRKSIGEALRHCRLAYPGDRVPAGGVPSPTLAGEAGVGTGSSRDAYPGGPRRQRIGVAPQKAISYPLRAEPTGCIRGQDYWYLLQNASPISCFRSSRPARRALGQVLHTPVREADGRDAEELSGQCEIESCPRVARADDAIREGGRG